MKRKDGEGSISWSESRQRFIVAVSVEGNRIKKEVKEEADAVKMLQSLRRKYGLVKYGGQMSLSDWYQEWLFEIKAQSLKPRSIADYKNVFEKHIKEYPIAKMSIAEITKTDITRHFNRLAKDGKSLQTIKKVKLRMSGCFTAADDYIEKNPVKFATLPKAKDNHRIYTSKAEKFAVLGENVYSKEEQTKLINALGSDWYVDFLLLFILGSGLRIGEALALNYIDIKDGKVHINKAVQRTPIIVDREVVRYERLVDTPKTVNSIRTVPLPNILIEGVQKRIREIKAQDELFTDNGLLFPNEFGDYLNDRRVLRRLKALQSGLKLPNSNVHGLRHSYATRLLEAGKPIQTISKLLGHANVELTQGIYAHVMDSLKDDAVEILDSILGGKVEKVNSGSANDDVGLVRLL